MRVAVNWRSRKTGTWHLNDRLERDLAAELVRILTLDSDVEIVTVDLRGPDTR